MILRRSFGSNLVPVSVENGLIWSRVSELSDTVAIMSPSQRCAEEIPEVDQIGEFYIMVDEMHISAYPIKYSMFIILLIFFYLSQRFVLLRVLRPMLGDTSYNVFKKKNDVLSAW